MENENDEGCAATISDNEKYLYFEKTVRTLFYVNTSNESVFIASYYFTKYLLNNSKNYVISPILSLLHDCACFVSSRSAYHLGDSRYDSSKVVMVCRRPAAADKKTNSA